MLWSVLLIWRVHRLYRGSPCNIICSCNFILILAWELVANVAGFTYDTVVKDLFAQFSYITQRQAAAARKCCVQTQVFRLWLWESPCTAPINLSDSVSGLREYVGDNKVRAALHA
jgi:hypothetical protein